MAHLNRKHCRKGSSGIQCIQADRDKKFPVHLILTCQNLEIKIWLGTTLVQAATSFTMQSIMVLHIHEAPKHPHNKSRDKNSSWHELVICQEYTLH